MTKITDLKTTFLKSPWKICFLIFFSMSWPWKIGLWTCIWTLYLFSKAFFKGGGVGRPFPQSIHRFRPPILYRVKVGYHAFRVELFHFLKHMLLGFRENYTSLLFIIGSAVWHLLNTTHIKLRCKMHCSNQRI